VSAPYIEVSRDGWTKGIQVSINDDAGGYRLSGPKFNGSQVTIAKAILSKHERAELRKYLDRADAAEAGGSA
jgi:hypothetical protein